MRSRVLRDLKPRKREYTDITVIQNNCSAIYVSVKFPQGNGILIYSLYRASGNSAILILLYSRQDVNYMRQSPEETNYCW